MTGAFALHSHGGDGDGEEAKGQELCHGTSQAPSLTPIFASNCGVGAGQELGSPSTATWQANGTWNMVELTTSDHCEVLIDTVALI